MGKSDVWRGSGERGGKQVQREAEGGGWDGEAWGGREEGQQE